MIRRGRSIGRWPLAALVATTLVLTGCGGEEDDNGRDTSADTAAAGGDSAAGGDGERQMFIDRVDRASVALALDNCSTRDIAERLIAPLEADAAEVDTQRHLLALTREVATDPGAYVEELERGFARAENGLADIGRRLNALSFTDAEQREEAQRRFDTMTRTYRRLDAETDLLSDELEMTRNRWYIQPLRRCSARHSYRNRTIPDGQVGDRQMRSRCADEARK